MVEVADGAAEKHEQCRQFFVDGGKAVFVARVDAVELDLREITAHRRLGGEQTGDADIDGRELAAAALAQLLGEQVDGFLAVAGAELDDALHRRGGDNVFRLRFEDAVLGAGEIVFRQFADLFEQVRALVVVKMIGFEPARLVPQRRQYRQCRDRVKIYCRCNDQMPRWPDCQCER